MTIGQGFMELAKTASDYINGGMNQESAYQTARNARLREANRKIAEKNSAPEKTNPEAPETTDATPNVGDGPQNA